MPPFVGRKRVPTSPIPAAPPRKKAKTKSATGSERKTQAAVQPKGKEAPFYLSDSESSLSEIESDEFEDVASASKPADSKANADNSDEDEVDWEDAPAEPAAPDFSNREFKDVKITVDKDDDPTDYTVRARTKKGPSRREKESRMLAHKMHVQVLLWHNAKRNAWINDEEVHKILLSQLPSQITREIDRWRRASGLTSAKETLASPKDKKKKGKKWKANGERNERDWGRPSQLVDEGKPNMSSGDPIITLLKILAAFWKKKFAITAPGLRKRGYGPKVSLRKDIDSFKNDKHHPAKHGERIVDIQHFRELAKSCEGSRDAGAQLFTALLRAIGIQSRMVASLQPVGFGFTKVEEMIPRRIIDPEEAIKESGPARAGADKKNKPKPSRKIAPGVKGAPIELDSDIVNSDSSDDSLLDVTPSMPKAKPAKYDRDLAFPIYWTEIISPITSKVYPVTPFLFENPVATSPDLLMAFEPKGAKAEQTRQVMAYVVAYSSDCTAKDVTIRYLRKRQWPGKTKAFRVPLDKIPIYDQRGKVKRYEDYDWFKHALGFYTRSDKYRTAADDIEDTTDLVPAEPEKKHVEGDTLQSLKTSPDFVIEKHLRREEALLPHAKPVRTFVVGKGDKQEEHQVYRRVDVRRVMTAESWHKEGRAPKEGEAPMKLAPVRAVTLARKREAEAHLIRTGEKQMQGLYSEDQTDYIIPPPIQDGIIPKNSYGNIDCFVPTMIPQGAVHLPLKGTVRICKKLQIDFAEAVVGFEFGNKMAVPVIHGVVVAKENEKMLRDAWRAWNEEQRKKEETKMEKLVLDLWRKMVTGLRIRARVSEEYGVSLGEVGVAQGTMHDQPIALDNNDDDDKITSGVADAEMNDDNFGGGFLVDHEDEPRPVEDLIMDQPMTLRETTTVETRGLEGVDQDLSSPVSSAADKSDIDSRFLSRVATDDISLEGKDNTLHLEKGDNITGSDDGGGFLVDENPSETSESPMDIRPTTQAKRQSIKSQPRKASARAKSDHASKSTRKTPRRAAKSQIYNMKESSSSDDAINGSSEDQITNDEGVKAAADRPRPRRGRPTRTRSKDDKDKTGRSLRKESTIITSPYFK